MILALDGGIGDRTCGWAIVRPRTGTVINLGVLGRKADASDGKNVDRIERVSAIAVVLERLCQEHDVHTIAAEAISLPPKAGVDAYASIFMFAGMVATLAASRVLCTVAPKTWQRAVVPEAEGAVDYDAVFARLLRFTEGMVADQLARIIPSKRNHALDAVGVGVYAALRMRAPTGIGRAAA